jgi:hypothetical protein
MDEPFDSIRRELCPDGACIGLIGPDGRCKVCGQVSPSAVADPRHRGMIQPAGDQDGEPFDTDRELCPDDACIGLLGLDGRCKVCGTRGDRAGSSVQAASPAAAAEDRRSGTREPAAAQASPAGEALEVDEEDDRELCPDGACIGLLGPDGRCKVCGTARQATGS